MGVKIAVTIEKWYKKSLNFEAFLYMSLKFSQIDDGLTSVAFLF